MDEHHRHTTEQHIGDMLSEALTPPQRIPSDPNPFPRIRLFR